MRYLLFGILLAIAFPTLGKDSLRISFIPVFRGDTIAPGKSIPYMNHSLVLDVFRFYISNVRFQKKGKVTYREKNSFHLMDFSSKETMQLSIPLSEKNLQSDSILIHLGIDSATNVSGALGGDLDPTKGMYWAWQSGYINMKIEGRSGLISQKDSTFQYHLGGYAAPFSTLQSLRFVFPKNKKLNIVIDLFPFLEKLRLNGTSNIMSPGKNAVQLSAFVSTLFAQQP